MYRAGLDARADPARRAGLAQSLSVCVRAMSLLGLLGLSLGPGFSYTALRLIYGEVWATSSAPQVLAADCTCLALLAVNGAVECVYVGGWVGGWWVRLCMCLGAGNGYKGVCVRLHTCACI